MVEAQDSVAPGEKSDLDLIDLILKKQFPRGTPARLHCDFSLEFLNGMGRRSSDFSQPIYNAVLPSILHHSDEIEFKIGGLTIKKSVVLHRCRDIANRQLPNTNAAKKITVGWPDIAPSHLELVESKGENKSFEWSVEAAKQELEVGRPRDDDRAFMDLRTKREVKRLVRIVELNRVRRWQ